MEAADRWLYEYAVIRFVPRIDREEFVNIGLIMMCKRQKWLRAMVLIDEDRLRALHPAVNLELLKRQSQLFERKDVPFKDLPVEDRYRWLTAAKSAMLQTSASHPGVIMGDNPSLDNEFNRLFSDLVM